MFKRFLLLKAIRLLMVLSVFALIFPAPVKSQNTASVNGYVSDATTGETLIAANVGFLDINRGMATNSSGYYSITNVPPGTYTLAASYIGYESFQLELTLGEGESVRLDIELTPEDLAMEQVLVTASEENEEELRNIGVAQVQTQLIRELPSVFEPDVFRSIQLLPGVKAASDFSSGLYIRGGSPDQTLILLDQTTVYNPSHFFGFYSTFNPDAVKDVRLYKGGYPAEFGGRLGSVLSVFNKDGNRNEFQGSASVGLLASRAMVEGPHKYGSWMLAIRRSTLEPLLAALRTQSDGIPDSFYFLDVNGKVNVDLSQNDRISVAFYSGMDQLSVSAGDDADIALDYGNRTVSSNWRHIFSEKLFATVTATASRYFSEPQFNFGGTPFERNNDIYDYSVKGDLEYYPNEKNTVSAGIWSGVMTLRLRDMFDNRETLSSRIQSHYTSYYLQNQWDPVPAVTLTAGIRGNHFTSGGYMRIEPRVSLEVRPHSNIRFQAAYGRYYQFLTLITNEAFSGFDLWLTTDEGVRPAYGDQFVLGAKTIPFENWGFDAEIYYRTMRDLFELNPFITDPAGLDYEELFRFGSGYAYGTELFLERREGNLTGFLGYTFSVSRRKFPGFNEDVLDNTAQARFYPPKYDRTHDVNVVLQYRLSSRWRLSTVFNYATGQAYTEPTGRMQMRDMPWQNVGRNTFVVDRLNAARLPSYHRLDLGMSRIGSFLGVADAEWNFQVINAYSRRNVWFYQYDFDENPVERSEVGLLPIIPAVSYTVTF